jgi:hypothetical protein
MNLGRMTFGRRLGALAVALAFVLPLVATDRCSNNASSSGAASSPRRLSGAAQSDARWVRGGTGRNRGATSGLARRRLPGRGTAGGVSDDEYGATVSFADVRDFATGADPSADAFNHAHGDQIQAHQAHSDVSDGVALGDFDGDGALDAVQTNVLAGSLSVFKGNGRGGFAEPKTTPLGVSPSFVLAQDLNSDRLLDLAIADAESDRVFVLPGDGKGGFGDAQSVPVPAPRNIAVGDLDRNGVADLAVASSAGAALFLGTKSTDGVSYGSPQLVTVSGDTGAPANSVALGDFDGVGGDDLVLGTGNSSHAGDKPSASEEGDGDDVAVYLNQNVAGSDAFARSPTQSIRVGGEPEAFVVARLDSDAHNDLAVLDSGNGDVASLLGDGRGHFTLKERNTTVGCLPRTLKLADVNDDRIADLVTAQFCESTVAVLRGRGDGTFDPAVDFWVGNSPTAVDVGRVDNDRRPDVVVARLRGDQLSLLRNETPRAGDGVTITRDRPYYPAADDLKAAHHTLDVYQPPAGTKSFGDVGRGYPVYFFAHGGAFLAGDKTTVTFLMRSLAREGIVAVSTNYFLKNAAAVDEQTDDIAAAFRWTREHIAAFGGDPDNIVLSGQSAGGICSQKIATDDAHYGEERKHLRGLVLMGSGGGSFGAALPPPTLLLDGTDGAENALAVNAAAFAEQINRQGGTATAVVVEDRDHFSLVATLARPNDPGRLALLKFLGAVMR